MRLAPNAERNLAAIMSSMRDSVADHLERLNRHHENLKHTRYGFIVRPLVLTLGWIVVVVGIITIPFPGPGWLTVFIGIAILSLELHWASNLLAWGVRLYDRFFSWYHVQSTRMRYSLIAATIAEGKASTMWMIPSQFGDSLEEFAKALANKGDDGVFRYEPSEVDEHSSRLVGEDNHEDWFKTESNPEIAAAVAAANAVANKPVEGPDPGTELASLDQ